MPEGSTSETSDTQTGTWPESAEALACLGARHTVRGRSCVNHSGGYDGRPALGTTTLPILRSAKPLPRLGATAEVFCHRGRCRRTRHHVASFVGEVGCTSARRVVPTAPWLDDWVTTAYLRRFPTAPGIRWPLSLLRDLVRRLIPRGDDAGLPRFASKRRG